MSTSSFLSYKPKTNPAAAVVESGHHGGAHKQGGIGTQMGRHQQPVQTILSKGNIAMKKAKKLLVIFMFVMEGS